MASEISRRSVLKRTVVIAGAAGLSSATGSAAAWAAPGPALAPSAGKPSANGWGMEEGADDGGWIWTRPVPGTGLAVPLRIGEVETVLVHVLRRFHYEVQALGTGDVRAHVAPGAFAAPHESNHASGTAVCVRPASYPLTARDGLFPPQVETIRHILADCEGVVTWGGDLKPLHEAHFEIAVRPGDARLQEVADKILAWNRTPGEGAGAWAG
ncbi:hypothetical protein AB0F13_07045 [Streptomyces sp. NPDC026206]|uniref:hypothetical protein n=1 Tax=Streptomyces sp. NPDC026206 TaxID=3157089 RepID=UPI0033C53450